MTSPPRSQGNEKLCTLGEISGLPVSRNGILDGLGFRGSASTNGFHSCSENASVNVSSVLTLLNLPSEWCSLLFCQFLSQCDL